MIKMNSTSAAEVTRHFVNDVVFNYSPQVDLLHDISRVFKSNFFQEVCKLMNIHSCYTTTYHSKANSKLERHNRTILAALGI